MNSWRRYSFDEPHPSMVMRALITGAGGFVGRHLWQHLRHCGDDVWGIVRSPGRSGASGSVQELRADLRDFDELRRVIRHIEPDVVYHLAAQSSTAESLINPWETLRNNLEGQHNLLEAVRTLRHMPRVLVVGSSDEYGRVRADQVPTDEDVALRPVTAYGVSKVGQDVMGYQYFAQHRVPVVRVRPFSHTGPGHDDRFVIPSFARQLAEIELGLRPPILEVGNLDVRRDFTDVRDVAQAYRLAVLRGTPGEVYNIGSGQSILLADIVHDLLELCRVHVDVVVDQARIRSSDTPRQQADLTRFTAATGWRARICLQTTLRDTLEYWRSRVGSILPTPLAGAATPG